MLIDLRRLGEVALVVIVTWLALGQYFDHAIAQADATVQWIPYLRETVARGADWENHLYSFGVIGGAALHDAGGTLPIVQACAALGLSATATANVVTISLQILIGYFGVVAIDALVELWGRRRLVAHERIVAVWACAFAPVLGWRFAYGHDNLILGLLPLAAALAVALAARAGTATPVLHVVAAFAVFTGLSGLGPQTLIYSIVFAGPIVLAIVLGAPRGQRWGLPQWRALAALAAGVLVVLPRLYGMIAHARGDDFARGSASLFHQFGTASARDWLDSIPWMATSTHERDYAIGPLVVLAALWPRGALRAGIAIAVCGAVAMLFGADTPVSDALVTVIPPLESFRVPARAILPVLLIVPIGALAALWSAAPPPPTTRVPWLYVLVAAVVIVAGGAVNPIAREVVAWVAVAAIVAAVRWRRTLVERCGVAIAIPVALGVLAFAAGRVPPAADRIDDGPRELHDRLVAQLPELRDPLHRVELANAPPPYAMSTAFAANLGSIDGVWFPTRRFLALLSAIAHTPVDPTTAVFDFTRSRSLPVLQQLYDVVAIVDLKRGAIRVADPPPPGPAWFPKTGVLTDTWPDGVDVRTTAVALHGDPVAFAASDDCARARVASVEVDGQTATIAVDSPADCVLVVSTNYVETLHATTPSGELAVGPIDIALTGIQVPAGASRITLAPAARIPWWTRVAQLVGLALLVLACLRRR